MNYDMIAPPRTTMDKSLITRIPAGIMRRVRRQISRLHVKQNAHDTQSANQSMCRVRLDRILLGDENGIPAATYARMVGDLLRPSTPVSESPHAKLLQQYVEMGEKVFEHDVLSKTTYYQNALLSIDIFGRYFDAKSEPEIVNVARRFVDTFRGASQSHLPMQFGQSMPEDPIRVRPIEHSDCYQVIDGHHRLAMAYVRGEREVMALPQPPAVLTPLQSLLLEVLWLKGRRELYQPVNSPELEQGWTLVRKCSDRLTKMHAFLQEQKLVPPALTTYLDIGSSYGWFVAEMGKLGFDAYGLERDPIAASVGLSTYGVRPEQVFRSDCVRFLQKHEATFDVTSCFSVLHHFAMGNGSVQAEELIRLIDRVTGRVLFFDTGENHEAWHKELLPEWDADFIENWLKRNTSFRRIYRLGVDEDAVPPFQENYGRMLFACVK